MGIISFIRNSIFGTRSAEEKTEEFLDSLNVEDVEKEVGHIEMNLESQYRQLDNFEKQEASIKERARYVQPHSGEFRSLVTKLKRIRRKMKEVDALGRLLEVQSDSLSRIKFFLTMRERQKVIVGILSQNMNHEKDQDTVMLLEKLQKEALEEARKYRNFIVKLKDNDTFDNIISIISRQDEIMSNEIEEELMQIIRSTSDEAIGNNFDKNRKINYE